MTSELKSLFKSESVAAAVRVADYAQLFGDLQAPAAGDAQLGVARLRVAAYAAVSDALGDGAESFLRGADGSARSGASGGDHLDVLRCWTSYISAIQVAGGLPSTDDLLSFVAIGLLARRPNEVRSLLRSTQVAALVRQSPQCASGTEWNRRVRDDIGIALLLIVLQESHEDVRRATETVDRLAASQRELESTWLQSRGAARADALSLLALYHTAFAVRRTAEFLVVGSVKSPGGADVDLSAELSRLIVKAEEYCLLSGDAELRLWLTVVAAILWSVRRDSIWAAGLGISERLDQLVHELARVGRDHPIFSLLPSQQDALRKNLLDPSRVAVVLQMPTSAGKTLLAEFAIVQAFEAYKGKARAVYVVPTRALASQIRRTLALDLRPLGIDVSVAGSAFEEDPYETQLLESAEGVIVTTPEKLDLLLRVSPQWFEALRLVVVDEAHTLKESERGARLELLLANLRREQPRTRLLLLTPFIENAQEIASWLGGERGVPIEVLWRPTRVLLGLSTFSGRVPNRKLTIEWKEPYELSRTPQPLKVPVSGPATEQASKLDKVIHIARRMKGRGTVLAMFASSRAKAEEAATAYANDLTPLDENEQSPGLRLAIALARSDFGEASTLADCLERGVAFHHSALSSMLRYLIEDQVRRRSVRFIAATSTLAQGMNFPVATVVIHSVHKPDGLGPLSPSEFWNIAGRAGRVGLGDQGLVVFVDSKKDREHWERYSTHLNETLKSALLNALVAQPSMPLKDLYLRVPESRPFIQFLWHAAAHSTPAIALAGLEELLQTSLANRQVEGVEAARAIREVARTYLAQIQGKSAGYLKVVDSTGLGSFSFDELYARIASNQLLQQGPGAVLRKQEAMHDLIDALRWLPELSLAIGRGPGDMDVDAVATVVRGWIDGKTIAEIARVFPGDSEVEKTRSAGSYVYSKVSQTISWGAHAYLRGWLMNTDTQPDEVSSGDKMLPAYIQHGVKTPEAAVASLMGVPRVVAESSGQVFRSRFGSLRPDNAAQMRTFLEGASESDWGLIAGQSRLSGRVTASDLRGVWREMHGLG